LMSPSRATPGGEVSSDPRKSILLVEDELLIRLVIAEELREAGHYVIEACDADEAMAILKATEPDLIISDVRMPGTMDGMGLLRLVKRWFPTLPVIITSGHLNPAHAVEQGASLFVSKPYTFDSVLDAANRLLGGAENEFEG
jgi:DNA-binding NtrC family response regulator